VQGIASERLLGETIGESFERTVARFGEREALVVRHQGVRYTYSQLGAEVDRLSRSLLAARIEVGDRVGIWAPNCAEWVLVQFATAKVGAILVNVNPAYRSSELEYALRQSGCRMLLSASEFKSSSYAAMIEEVRGGLPSLERVVLLDSPCWEALLAAGEWVAEADLRDRMACLDLDDPINIQYTSGTTGFPKGATLSHHNILNNAFFVGETCGYTEVDRVCIPVPFYHCFGMVIGNLMARRSLCQRLRSSRRRCCRRLRRSVARAFMASRRCSSLSSSIRPFRSTTSAHCARGSWADRLARLR
jgi:fatty-acyl-CoA synthase